MVVDESKMNQNVLFDWELIMPA